jgi:hypothetical protein
MGPENRERQLGETRSLRELRQQLQTLATAGARRRARPRRLVLALGAGVVVAIVLGGVALAGGFDGLLDGPSHRPLPKVLQPTPLNGSPIPSPTPYPTNAAGQTYGPAQPEALAEADLQAVAAERGENGYSWSSDLDGPWPMNPDEASWFTPAKQKRAIPIYKSDGVTQVGVFGDVHVPQPPVWLFDQMKSMATNAGDANAWAWWTRTTAEKAALATGNSTAGITDPERPVYLTIILGDFTRWLWSLPEGASAPEYSWIFEVIDAGSHEVEVTGAGAKPFPTPAPIDLNLVGLRDRVRM